MNQSTANAVTITPDQLLQHWQGHRRITRRVIEVFPEDKLFSYSVGGMRSFGDLVMEILGMGAPGVKGVVTGQWPTGEEVAKLFSLKAPRTKQELLTLWDDASQEINVFWAQIPPHRFQEIDVAFGAYKAPLYQAIMYWIDNEIHHRAQATVYLRSLGVEPPAFYDRS